MSEHPLDYILRKRTAKGLDEDIDLLCATNYFAGQFDNPIPVEKNREVWAHIKKLLTKE